MTGREASSPHVPARRPGPSVRLRLAAAVAAVVVVTGGLLLAVVALYLLRYVPARSDSAAGFVPGRGDLVDAFAPPALAVLVALLVVGPLVGWAVSARLFAPLDALTAAARRVGDGGLAHRVDLPGRDDEFRRLADSFDEMAARLERHVEAQRRFAANAAHELRTPLAVTRSLLDVARDAPDHDHDELLARLGSVNDRAVALTEALLALARADAPLALDGVVDLSLLAEDAVETLLPLAEARGVTLAADGDVALAAGEPDLLRQVVTNLVLNGVVHNVAGDRAGHVTVRTSVAVASAGAGGPGPGPSPGAGGAGDRGADGGRTAVVVVENTGPEVPPELVPTLTEPFTRVAGRLRDDHGGTGLGLALVAAVVRAHDGVLDVRARDGGGLVVTVRLRAATR